MKANRADIFTGTTAVQPSGAVPRAARTGQAQLGVQRTRRSVRLAKPIYCLLSWALVLCGIACLGQETAGVGVVLGMEGDQIVVKKVLPDTPAASSKSIGEHDRILAVGQANETLVVVQGIGLNKVVQLFRGARGTTVRVTIVPAGKSDPEARVVSFVRGELKALSRWGNGQRLPAGTEAPDIQFIRLADNKSGALSDYRGKIVVLEFWATWCGPCQEAMARLQTYLEKYPEWKGKVNLLTASVDESKEDVVRRLTLKAWDKTQNVWVDRPAIKAYQIDSIPTVYVIDTNGKIVDVEHRADIPDVVNGLLAK